MKRYCYICGYETTDKNMYTCPECLCDDVFVQTKEEEELLRLLNNRELTNAMIKLKQNDPIEYQLKLNQFKLQKEQAENIKRQKSAEKTESLTCPKCGSTNITEGTKGFSIMTGFIGSSNFRYVCKNCGNKWKPGSMLETLQRANNRH